MTVAGLIFSNIHDRNIPELTQKRTMASIPFGGRYRLIDFTLSNMVNADITKVGIITHYNYQSLMDHIGSGKDWDLSRSDGGVKILPPFITAYDNTTSSMQPYSSRLEALMGAYNFISRCKEDYFVLSDCDIVCNIDLKDVIRYHIDNHADITIVAKHTYLDESHIHNATLVETDGSVPTDGQILVNGCVPYKNRVRNAENIGVVFGQRSQLWWALPLVESFLSSSRTSI